MDWWRTSLYCLKKNNSPFVMEAPLFIGNSHAICLILNGGWIKKKISIKETYVNDNTNSCFIAHTGYLGRSVYEIPYLSSEVRLLDMKVRVLVNWGSSCCLKFDSRLVMKFTHFKWKNFFFFYLYLFYFGSFICLIVG